MRGARQRRSSPSIGGTGATLLLTALVALVFSVGIIYMLEMRMRPMIATIAEAQAVAQFTQIVDAAVMDDLATRNIQYKDFVTIERGDAGRITALTTDVASMNYLRGTIITAVYETLDEVDITNIEIPLGNLLNSQAFWGKGPNVCAQSMAIGNLSAEFESEFTEAGINQTSHRIYLQMEIPLSILMAGQTVETILETQLCVAETIIVGEVPDSYLQFGNLSH